MSDKSSEIRKLEAEATRILKRRQRHEARGRRLAEAERGHDEAIDAVILSAIRTAGLTQLPLSELLEHIRAIGLSVATSDVGESAPKRNDDSEALHLQSGGSMPEHNVDRGGSEVFVKLSSNASAAHRQILEQSGLRWNGRRGGWVGNVGDAATDNLRERFGDRLLVLSAPVSSETGPDEEPREGDPTTSPISPSSAGPSGSAVPAEAEDAVKMTPAAGVETSSAALSASAVDDNARLPSSSLPPRPGAFPKIPFARHPRADSRSAD